MFKELATLFALCAGSLLTLLLIGRLLQLRELLLNQNLGLLDVGRMLLYLSPFFLLLLIPIACMLSVFLTLLRMNTDLETTALRASGVSLYQLLPAPILLGTLCTLAAWWISFHGLAWGMENFRSTMLELARSKTQLVLQPGVFNREFPGITLYAQQADGASGELRTVFVKDATRGDSAATILAPEGRVRTDTERGEIVFQLRNGRIYREEPKGMSVIGFGTYQVKMDLSKMLSGYKIGEMRPKEMSWSQLNQIAERNEREGLNDNSARKVQVEIHKRLVLPLACLVLSLFAVPLASMFSGLHRHWGLLLALGFFLFYYTLLSLGLSLGETGAMPPALGLWLPNGVFLLTGLYGLRQAARERSFTVIERLRHIKLFGRRTADVR
ncbi:lipopolysaccharide export system permease protein [Desulfobaculum xiamenense]|uniref:Lipopolysaccharide export system permease protein n=1 Tax=Desulfobaculum xiamenense TaxID=995050 RepID=A0A846QK24_9BACT|nr:LPS export ABC transporter permease LptF [Desulfobaculum xiamenense]NJB66832.1 lipopolysaccharide export system permease protein [Desulfobaculum xiamenense]